MQIYQFKMWGKAFAVDTGSGNFFEVDKACSEAIGLLEKYPDREAETMLSQKYKTKSAARMIRNLFKLKRQGIIFSGPKEDNDRVKRRITDLTLNIINKCNLSCRYCWNNAGSYGPTANRVRRMDKKTAFRAVDLLIEGSGRERDLVVDFYGGEPLLNFELIRDTVNYCRGIQKSKKINFSFLLATNGTLLTRDKSSFLLENRVDTAVSLDGPQRIQDKHRPFADGRGSFDVIMYNLNSLGEAERKRIVGRATFTPYSSGIVRIFKFLRSLGFDRIEVCESERAGYGLEPDSGFFFSGEKGLNRLKSIYYNLAVFYCGEIIKGNLNYENTYFNRFFKQLSRLYHIQSIAGSCSAGFSLMAVDTDSGIYPCTAFVGMPQFKIGDVKSGIDEERLRHFSSIKISSNRSCAGCWARRICRGCGSCYNLNYFANKNLGRPDPYHCELFRYKTKLMIAMIAKVNEKKPGLLDKVLIPEYYAKRGRRNGG